MTERQAMTVWGRHEIDPTWHVIVSAERQGSFVTACNGRWPATDNYAISVFAPMHCKCGICAQHDPNPNQRSGE